MSEGLPRWFSTGDGPHGALRSEVDSALEEVRDPAGSQRIAAVLARDVADAADSARQRDDLGSYLRATARLEQLLVRAGVTAGSVDDGGGGSEGGSRDPLAGIVGPGSAVGDAEDA